MTVPTIAARSGDALPDLALNARAWALADDMVARADELRVAVHATGAGARVIDAGVEAVGGLGAGLRLAELCMGGLGHVRYTPLVIDGETWPGVQVWSDHPAVSCMAAQYAGWAVQHGGYFAMGSGPLRAHARVERELFAKLGYAERAERGVLVLETRALPTDDVVEWIAARAELPASALTFAVAPTASVAGGTQVVARVLETGLHKIDALGFDVTRVESAIGTAPVPPPARNDLRAIGRTNDCVLYGGQARYVVRATDDELAALADRLPASASADYGIPFYETFERAGRDFYKIDPLLFSPAEVWLTSATSGRTFHAGRIDAAVLRTSLYGG
ncbi:MAG TPA: methenyltetrahydromethanopterin cyclohydrolase [Gemmatirosa sp.]